MDQQKVRISQDALDNVSMTKKTLDSLEFGRCKSASHPNADSCRVFQYS